MRETRRHGQTSPSSTRRWLPPRKDFLPAKQSGIGIEMGQEGLEEFTQATNSATKAALRSFARTWTMDLKDRRIPVNAVSPGFIDTPGLNDLLASTGTATERKKMMSNSVPLGRFGRPDEVAKAVVFLASDDSSYITGTELFADGGFAQV